MIIFWKYHNFQKNVFIMLTGVLWLLIKPGAAHKKGLFFPSMVKKLGRENFHSTYKINAN